MLAIALKCNHWLINCNTLEMIKKLATAVQINEGVTRPAAIAELGTDAFDAQGNLVVGNTATVKHAGESSVVSGTKSALASTAMAWRNNTNDLQRRLG